MPHSFEAAYVKKHNSCDLKTKSFTHSNVLYAYWHLHNHFITFFYTDGTCVSRSEPCVAGKTVCSLSTTDISLVENKFIELLHVERLKLDLRMESIWCPPECCSSSYGSSSFILLSPQHTFRFNRMLCEPPGMFSESEWRVHLLLCRWDFISWLQCICCP